ncbi:MAG: hypothetical protein V2A76_06820 [Planctomycetota bacterium]
MGARGPAVGPASGGPATGGPAGPETPAGVTINGETGPTTGFPDFIPGQDGNLYWNTSVLQQGRPVLVYLYNGHVISDDDCKRSRQFEKNCFPDEAVIKEARGFVCEKICFGCSEFSRKTQHREVIRDYLKRVVESGSFESKIVLLDASGQTLAEFKDEAPSAKKLAAALKKANPKKANAKK